ncbi:MAG: MBL fold metallo-hydrolase [Halovenus sp.]
MTAIHSDWGNWLPKAVADADPDGLAVWYLGCNGFVLKSAGDTTLCIDPYLGTGDPPRTVRMIPVPFDPADFEAVDAVLATHEHTDHVHGPSQAPLLEKGGTFYAPDASMAVTCTENWTERWAVGDDQFRTVSEGETLRIGDLTVSVEPANDPDAEHPVSYVFEHASGTFFHGGDARPGAFAGVGTAYDIDVGALALGSTGMIRDKETGVPERTTWYNDENMIVEATNALKLDRLVPTHWDMWKGLRADPTALHHHTNSFEFPRVIDIVEIGDRVDV